MRRTVLLLASMALVLLLACGVALAAIVNCVEGEHSCVGTNEDDTLNGSEVRDRMFGLAGNDTLLGNGRSDGLRGGPGTDTIRGGEGQDSVWKLTGDADKIYGEDGDDDLEDWSSQCTSTETGRVCVDDPNVLKGGNGNDSVFGATKLYGGPGNDIVDSSGREETQTILNGGSGRDWIFGYISKDTIYAQDGEQDTISCGGGTDTVYYDEGIDSVDPDSCENLNPPQ